MCEANAYLISEGSPVLVMEAVDLVEPDGEGLRLENIFGEQKYLRARIRSLALNDHKVVLEPL